ncbi:MAG: cupin domain-containing protein [Bryobacteraceae bacterium]
MCKRPLPLSLLSLLSIPLFAAERPVDPTFLKTSLSKAAVAQDDLTAPGSEFRPLFTKGGIVRGVARFGEASLAPGSASPVVQYPREEQIYYVTAGSGEVVYAGKKHPIRADDFLYLAPTIAHGLVNTGDAPLKVLVMGYPIPASTPIRIPDALPIANASEVKKQVVGNHPPSTLYQLLIGDQSSTRDRIAAAHVVTSLFLMEFAPGGTNFPHHHDREEEVYVLLEGEGQMVAGGGASGVEGRHPAKAGDAYFYRLNATVGFYNRETAGVPKARILAIRSLYPFARR